MLRGGSLLSFRWAALAGISSAAPSSWQLAFGECSFWPRLGIPRRTIGVPSAERLAPGGLLSAVPALLAGLLPDSALALRTA